MSETIEHILGELYELEPALRAREAELRPMVEKLLALRPEPVLDEQFVALLRQELMHKAAEKPAEQLGYWFRGLAAFPYWAGAVAVVVLAVGAYVSTNSRLLLPSVKPDQELASAGRLPPRSFGSFQGSMAASEIRSAPQFGLGMPETISSKPSLTPAFGLGGGMGAAKLIAPAGETGVSGTMPAPPYYGQQVEYAYTGDPIELPQSVDVIKRLPQALSGSSMAEKLGLGAIDLRSFANLQMINVTLGESAPGGYQINVSVPDGVISLYASQPAMVYSSRPDCLGEGCGGYRPLTLQDIPSDDELVALTREFSQVHGVELAGYGNPLIQKDWLKYYNEQSDSLLRYVPEQVTVLYPLHMGGEAVYDQGGGQAGINFIIDIRTRKVINVWGITVSSYQVSEYAGIADVVDLLKLAQGSGSPHGIPIPLPYMMEGSEKPVTEPISQDIPIREEDELMRVELGTPARGYLRWYRYTTGGTEEYYLPSLVFPVVNVPVELRTFMQEKVIVPLVADYWPGVSSGSVMGSGGAILPLDIPTQKPVPPVVSEPNP